MSGPSAEEFTRWRDDRVTQWVFRSFAMIADENKAEWITASWDNGVADPLFLAELRTRADAYRAIFETPYEAHCTTLGDEPSYDDR
jgi:hypothetical protein